MKYTLLDFANSKQTQVLFHAQYGRYNNRGKYLENEYIVHMGGALLHLVEYRYSDVCGILNAVWYDCAANKHRIGANCHDMYAVAQIHNKYLRQASRFANRVDARMLVYAYDILGDAGQSGKLGQTAGGYKYICDFARRGGIIELSVGEKTTPGGYVELNDDYPFYTPQLRRRLTPTEEDILRPVMKNLVLCHIK